MATLEERVSKLEEQIQEVRHRTEAGLGSHALAIGLVYRDTQELLAGQARLESEVAGFRQSLEDEIAGVRQSLEVILSRLP